MGYGLKAEAVEGAAARGGSDGRDVVGGGCTPLSARATATNNHPWSTHGGFIRQVQPVFILSSHSFPAFFFFSFQIFALHLPLVGKGIGENLVEDPPCDPP